MHRIMSQGRTDNNSFRVRRTTGLRTKVEKNVFRVPASRNVKIYYYIIGNYFFFFVFVVPAPSPLQQCRRILCAPAYVGRRKTSR